MLWHTHGRRAHAPRARCADVRRVGLSPPGAPAPTLTARRVFFARGTTEPAPIGTLVGPPLAAALQRALRAKGNLTLAFAGVAYAADVLGFLEGGDPQGARAMANDLTSAASACPRSAALVTAGYSQGGQLVHNSARLLSPAVQARISAAVIFVRLPVPESQNELTLLRRRATRQRIRGERRQRVAHARRVPRRRRHLPARRPRPRAPPDVRRRHPERGGVHRRQGVNNSGRRNKKKWELARCRIFISLFQNPVMCRYEALALIERRLEVAYRPQSRTKSIPPSTSIPPNNKITTEHNINGYKQHENKKR
ncbi:unnamed protein product, partial [Mycena citricolor]